MIDSLFTLSISPSFLLPLYESGFSSPGCVGPACGSPRWQTLSCKSLAIPAKPIYAGEMSGSLFQVNQIELVTKYNLFSSQKAFHLWIFFFTFSFNMMSSVPAPPTFPYCVPPLKHSPGQHPKHFQNFLFIPEYFNFVFP